MEIFLITLAALAVLMCLWLNVLAMYAIRADRTLDRVQKLGQLLLVWIVPLVGAGFALHLAFEHNPQAVPRRWVPWPFRKMFFGAPPTPNKSRDENELDYAGTNPGRGHAGKGIGDAIDGD